MKQRALSFHVPGEAGPDRLRPLLRTLADHGPIAGSVIERSQLMEGMVPHLDGRLPRSEIITFASDIGILEVAPSKCIVTARAEALMRSDCAADLAHILHYFGWSPDTATLRAPMWTYRTLIDLLWEQAPVKLNTDIIGRLVEEIGVRAEQVFGGVTGFDPSNTSVGPKTVRGVRAWLEGLTPPALGEDGLIRRRQTCPPQVVPLALAEVARRVGALPGTDFRLAPETRTLLCRACFLAPEALDRMLDWTVATRPDFVRWGTLISTYGRQVVLARTDLAPEHLL